MPNRGAVINSHNSALTKTNNNTQTRQCDCHVESECLVDNKCLTKKYVYEVTVKTRTTEQGFIGMTSCTFKRRYYSYISSFRHEENRHCTSLSNHIFSWKIRKQALPYSPLTDRRNLCNWEKLLIITAKKSDVLNKRTELLSQCPHKRQYQSCKMIMDKHIISFSTDWKRYTAEFQSMYTTTKGVSVAEWSERSSIVPYI